MKLLEKIKDNYNKKVFYAKKHGYKINIDIGVDDYDGYECDYLRDIINQYADNEYAYYYRKGPISHTPEEIEAQRKASEERERVFKIARLEACIRESQNRIKDLQEKSMLEVLKKHQTELELETMLGKKVERKLDFEL